MPKPRPLTRELIRDHERLYPRLAALLKQIERVAAKRSTQPVPEASVRLARQLCIEAGKLLRGSGRGIGVPGGGIDHQGLAVLLGQALAGLEAFEGEHSIFAARHGAICWQLGDQLLPVGRLRPTTPPKGVLAPTSAQAGSNAQLREKLTQRIVRRENYSYWQGYRDAQQGKPPRVPLTEFQAVP